MIQAKHSGKNNDSTITLKAEYSVPGMGEWVTHTTLPCDNSNDAAFKAHAINKKTGDQIQRLREQSYNEGWADAKAKRRKETHFIRWFYDAD